METIFTFFADTLRMSWQVSVLILLVLAAQWLCGPRLKARWRYMLWILVMLRLAAPWTIPFPGSLFVFSHSDSASGLSQAVSRPPAKVGGLVLKIEQVAAATSSEANHPLMWIWMAGALCLVGFAGVNQYKIHRRITRERPLIHEPALRLLEECKAMMGVRAPVTLMETDAISSPGLFGFIRPRLLLPKGLVSDFNGEELRHVFLHELAHVKRRDILIGWVMLLLQAVHWFNPLVWIAFHRMRADRELACDTLVLSRAQKEENESYGMTIIKLLEQFGQSSLTPGMAGILENKQKMKERISMIAKFRKTERGLTLAIFVLAGLTLATLTLSCRRSTETQSTPKAPEVTAPEAVQSANTDDQTPPQIVSTSPGVGQTDVDPTTTEITVTFDRDMGKGFSWTGGGADYPTITGKPQWRDKRTCVLPVRLVAGHYYRAGINSTSYQNFKSAQGVPAQPSAIYFTTQGASQDLQRNAAQPEIVSLDPRNGDTDVDPKLSEIRVTFNVAMGDGCSWTGGGSAFPKIPQGKSPYWTPDHMTCILPVELEPGKTYRFGLNSPSYRNFQSEGGVALEPVTVTFKTRNE